MARRKIRYAEDEIEKRRRRTVRSVLGANGMYPLDSPGMPPPGPDFVAAAAATGDDTVYVKGTKKKEAVYTPGVVLKNLYRRALREPGFQLQVAVGRNRTAVVTFVPGHIWGQHIDEWAAAKQGLLLTGVTPVDGPHPADVMVVGKMPWRDETADGRNLIGASAEILIDVCKRLRIRGTSKWYVTNLCKFTAPGTDTRIAAGWKADCMPLLHQELRIVRPKYILCLGADASKAILGEKAGVNYMMGRVVPFTYPLEFRDRYGEVYQEGDHHTAHVMTVIHPAEVARAPEKERLLESNMGRFAYLLKGRNLDISEDGLDHRVVDTLEEAEEWVQEVNAEFAGRPAKDRLVAWDAEWQGQHPQNKGSYLRTIQVSWGHKKAICFKVAHQGGKNAFVDASGRPAFKRLARLLNGFMEDKRAVGHFLVADLEWLNYYGVFPTRGCKVPLEDAGRTPAWRRLQRGEGWLDTAMMQHALEETSPLGLEVLSMRYTMCPRYDIPLEEAISAICKDRGIKREALEGYGDVPDDVLLCYANYDADVTLRIARELLPLMDSDHDGNCVWEPLWESMIIQPVILAIHCNGITVDRHRIDDLTKKFITARAAQEDKIRSWAKWPDFNIRSVQQVKEFLFGEKLNGKLDKLTGEPVRIRPEGARSLKVQPLLDTSKPPRRWADLVAQGRDQEASPGTGKMVLGILAEDNLPVSEQIGFIRDHRFLDQVLKSLLRPPVTDEHDNFVMNDDGFLEYDAGLAASIDDDGRVRTHLYPTAETGRWKSSRPNLQNISKSRDPDYERLLGTYPDGSKVYKNKLRSVLKASPGCAFIEFDYKGAELYMMSIMAGAEAMRNHCERANNFADEGYDIKGRKHPKGHDCVGKCKACKKDDTLRKTKHVCKGGCALCGYPSPEYYDIHSNVAKLAFQLDCHPSKFGLDQIGKSHFRTLAKNVIFGIAYGRGAKAIALQAKEQKVNVTPDEAQAVIDAIFEIYPELPPFFDEAKRRAKEEGWLCHCFGRFRRFPSVKDFKLEGEFERQAMNFPS